ncbi:AraC family transcriptional regulator [Paenibacillus alginolyticus]|uniref:AraC family transcriptional regulator n=1 Tax=Paenibacillus alginolyticus TaxID=59839 RepID=UPI0004273F6C|nr:AraC family transcriptional regulator [Paenibacillus alginolyticus]MCY9669991.1 AraC family transcriptional regulator [Paenibacillus alginolyticus]
MRINHFIAQPRFNRFVCYPDSFGHYYNDPSHSETRAAGQFGSYNWHIVRSGIGYLKVGDDTIKLHAGSGFLYGPGVEQIYYTDSEDPWDIRWVHFQGEGIGGLLQGKGAQEVWTFSWKSAERLDDLWSDLLSNGVPSLGRGEVRLSALLYEMISELANNAGNTQISSGSGQRNKIIAAAEWIRLHSEEFLTLELMAEIAGYSVSHFSRQFHLLIGKTPIEFLTECRILQSKILLVSTDLSVKDVSEKVGFSSSAYYIQRFRKSENMTPEQFRRMRRGSTCL